MTGALPVVDPESLDRIFELVESGQPDDRWVVTETAVVNPKQRYRVDYSRLNELNWNEHVGGKGWVNRDVFEHALDVGVYLIRDKYVDGVLPSYLPSLWQSPGRDKSIEVDYHG
ncbi:MAG: hypothetical protein ACRDRU_20685 [Pseudonocardiaceae bacterium]